MVDIKEQLRNAPYFDDYDENDNYYRMLFRPRFAVQARELTQLQTMFQSQIERMGRHFFKEGSMVIPGICNFDTNYNYVKVFTSETIDNSAFFTDDVAIQTNFVGKIINSPAGVRARVVNYTNPDQNGICRLYIKYLQAGSDTNSVAVKRFRSSEQLTVEGSGIILETFTDPNEVVGTGTGATIKEGVYFTNGFFAVVQQQAIVVEPESTSPTVSIGLDVNITIVTPEEDEGLLDNAQGAPNYAAPGAHRLKIELVLTTRPVDRITTTGLTDTEFIELIRLNNGFISEPPNRTDYNILRDEMARRTFDESGHYVIKPFVTVVQEFLNDGTNNGVYTLDMLKRTTSDAAEQVGLKLLDISGSHPYGDYFLPGSSTEIFEAAARTKLVYRIDPGKAYVKGFEIEKLDRSIAIGRKALDTISVAPNIVKTTKGPFIRITNVFGLPAVGWGEARESNNSFEEILLFSRKREFMESTNVPIAPGSSTLGSPDRTIDSPYCIGVARAIYFDYESGVPGASNAEYLLHLIDIQITKDDYNIEHVQSFYQASVGGAESTIGFSADAFQYTIPLLGATITSSSATFRDQADAKNAYWKTLEEQRISPNDNLVAGSVAEGDIVYLYATAPALNNQSISVDKSDVASFTDLTVTKLYTVLEEQDTSTFLYPLPFSNISSIDLESVDFTVQKLFVNQKSGSTITINIPTGEGIFDNYSAAEWFFAKDDGTLVRPINVDFVTSTEASITFDSTVGDVKIVSICAVRLNGQNQVTKRDKTLRQGIYQNTGTPSGQHYLITPVNERNLQTISLEKTDVIRVKAIYMSFDFTLDPTPNDPNIVDRYTLDNGQRDAYYDVASIQLNRGAQPPTGRLAIVYDWFEHSPDGSYFCVDSYPIGPDFSIEDIPSYTSVDTGRTYFLGDVFDFRSTINVSTREFRERIFYLPEANILAGFDHFLNRRDKLYITPQGEFKVLEGVSAVNPVFPPDPVDGMVTAEINLPALTRRVSNVEINHRNNRRYTMRDIGKIEDRIGQIEYYTSLSLLETDTEKLVIKDAQGNDRFKNGFMVDNFRGHATGDTSNIDYSCSVDPLLGILRPSFVERGVELEEVKPYENNLLGFTPIASESDRLAANYTKKGDLLMLNYEVEPVPQMQQMYATSFINVNPFEVISFVGRGTLTPNSDEFKSTELLAEKIVDLDTGLTDALTDLSTGLGTIYTFDSVNFETQQTDEIFEKDILTQSPPIPAPSWHVEEDGSLGIPNELTTLLANRGQNQKDLNKKKKLKKKLKGELKSTKDKREKKGIRQRLKAISEQIKNLRPQVSLKNPPSPSFPRLSITQDRIVTNTSTTAKGGKKITVNPKTIETSLGDSVKSINFAEYCRSQIIRFDLVGMSPGSRLYMFIDDIPLTHMAIPDSLAQTIYMPFAERNAETAFSGNSASATSEIIFDPRPETGVNASNDAYSIIVSETGSASGYIFLPNGKTILTPNGVEYLTNSVFNPKIKTGEKTIRFTDSPQNISQESDTSCNIKFTARGLVEQRQNTILSTKSAEVATEFANEEKVITNSKQTSYKLSYATWNDPIAETIIVEEPGGMFVTGVEIFFRRKPHRGTATNADNGLRNTTSPQSPIVPVSVEIRENAVGIPGPFTLPGSRVFLDPNQIVVNDILNDQDPFQGGTTRDIGLLRISIPNGDANNALDTNHAHYEYTSFGVDNSSMPTWDPKTRTLSASMPANGSSGVGLLGTYFEFEYPIYLQERTEYSVVIRSNCQDYECWYARIGQSIIGSTDRVTTTGAYNGVFLKSANSSTWTPDQQADLMFKMYRAQFPTNTTGEITFVNQARGFDKLENNPFKVEEGSSVVKVYHKNHGMRNRQASEQKPRVKISGLVSDLAGIDYNLINTEGVSAVNKYHDVTVLDFDTYCFEVFDGNGKPVHANATTYRTGGNTVFATSDIQVDEMLVNISNINFDETNVDYSYRISSGAGVHGGLFEPYELPGVNVFSAFQPGQQIIFNEPKLIPGEANEGRWNYLDSGINGIMTTPTNGEGSSKGLFVTASLSTDNPNVSPIIDLSRTSVLCIGNKVSDAGLVDEYKAFCEPNDLVFFDWTEVTGPATGITNTGIGDIATEIDKFHVGGFIKIVDSSFKTFIAKISNIVANSLEFESPIGNVDDSGTVTVYSSGLPVFSFGDIPVSKANNVLLSIASDSFSTTDPAVISDLVEVFEGNLIKITETATPANFVVTRVISVIRTSSTDITVRVEADLQTELGIAGNNNFDIALYDDVFVITSDVAGYDAARNVGKQFQNAMQPGQYIRVLNTTDGKNDGDYEIIRISEDDDGSTNYKLTVEVDYDVDEDVNPSSVTVVGIEDFYSLESPQKATSSCSYITKRMVLANPCTSLKVKFLANVQEGQNIGVFAKFSGMDTIRKFDDTRYEEISPLRGKIPGFAKGPTVYHDYEYEEQFLAPFTEVAIKITLQGEDSTKPIKIQDLQIIALDS